MSRYTAPALEKGLDIMEYLSEIAIPQSQIEISQALNKSPNEIYRMLACLEHRGYLIKSASGKYSLSLKLYQLSHRHSPIDGLLKISKTHMEDLSNKTKQSCHMGILYQSQLMVISQSKSPGPVSISIEEGSLFPLIKTCSGRVILANMDKSQRMEVLANNKDFTSLDKKKQEEFIHRLKRIKERGYELGESEITFGVTDISIPIGNTETGVFSVLAISSLTSVTQQNEAGEFLIESIKQTANLITTRLKQ